MPEIEYEVECHQNQLESTDFRISFPEKHTGQVSQTDNLNKCLVLPIMIYIKGLQSRRFKAIR